MTDCFYFCVIGLRWIQTGSAVVGMVWIVMTALIVTVVSFNTDRFALKGLHGHCIGALEVLQFIGISSLIGVRLPPLYILFSTALSWTNYLWSFRSLKKQIYGSSDPLCISGDFTVDVSQGIDQPWIFFVNFILVACVIFLTLLFCMIYMMIRLGTWNLYKSRSPVRFCNVKSFRLLSD